MFYGTQYVCVEFVTCTLPSPTPLPQAQGV